MKLNLVNQIKNVNDGLNPLPSLLIEQRQLERMIFLTAFHSLKNTLVEINLMNSDIFNNQPLFFSLDLIIGDFNTHISPDLFVTNVSGINQCYSDDKDRNSFIVKYSIELNKQACYLESPSASNFAGNFNKITIDLSKIDEINNLADQILSPENKSIYNSATLEIELSEFPKELRKKLKL